MEKEFLLRLNYNPKGYGSYGLLQLHYNVGVTTFKKRKNKKLLPGERYGEVPNKFYWKSIVVDQRALMQMKRKGTKLAKQQIVNGFLDAVRAAFEKELLKQIKL